jgi:2-dehydro-3-deoxygluconokinase
MNKVLCFGELLLRLSPDMSGEWLHDNLLPVFVGGAELNVATALAKWKIPVGYCTALPGNILSGQILNALNEKKIDTTSILFSGKKIGIYYLPQGTDIKNTGVIYDRENSSFSEIQKGTIDWDNVLEGMTWFHFSAICPAISEQLADVCEEALKVCAKKNIYVSLDLNYRSKLWQYGKQPNEVIPQLAQYCDLIMGNVWSAEIMLNIPVNPSIKQVDTKENYLQQATETSKKIIEQYPKCKVVANTFRFDHNNILYYGTLFSEDQLYISSEYKTKTVIDKVGSGDCFMAGLIYGMIKQLSFQKTIDLAASAAFKKLFIKSDSINKTLEEIKSFIKNYE